MWLFGGLRFGLFIKRWNGSATKEAVSVYLHLGPILIAWVIARKRA